MILEAPRTDAESLVVPRVQRDLHGMTQACLDVLAERSLEKKKTQTNCRFATTFRNSIKLCIPPFYIIWQEDLNADASFLKA